MLQRTVPRLIDFRKLAASAGEMSGSIPLTEFVRLRNELATDQGEVRFVVRFGVDEESFRYIEGEVRAELTLICQRCLEPFRQAVWAQPRLAMVWTESEIAALPGRFEGLVIGDDPGDFYELIEEEVLLALPLAPKHTDNECRPQCYFHGESDDCKPSRTNPFERLADLELKE